MGNSPVKDNPVPKFPVDRQPIDRQPVNRNPLKDWRNLPSRGMKAFERLLSGIPPGALGGF